MDGTEGTNIIEKAIAYFTDLGVSRGLAIAYLIVSTLLVVMAIVALIMWIRVAVVYFSTNKTQSSSGKNCMQIAREALDKEGLHHIQVKKASLLRGWILGNCYSITKKTVFLRGSIAGKNSLTAIGVALQKVGIAKLCESGDTKARTRNVLQIVGLFGPILFIPIMLIGMIIDLLVFEALGTFSFISIALGLFVVLAGFLTTLLNIPVEKKANKMAMEMLDTCGLFEDEEKAQIKRVLDTYIVAYICDFIVSVLRVVQLVLEIVMSNQISSNNS